MNINLGAGNLHKEGWINIDIVQPCDVICRVGKEKLPAEDNSCDRIEADNLLEHLDNDEFLQALNECHRVLKKDGVFWWKVPDSLSDWDKAAGDPTHKRFFTPRSFYYFDNSKPNYHNYGKSYGFKPWNVKVETDGHFFTCEMTPLK